VGAPDIEYPRKTKRCREGVKKKDEKGEGNQKGEEKWLALTEKSRRTGGHAVSEPPKGEDHHKTVNTTQEDQRGEHGGLVRNTKRPVRSAAERPERREWKWDRGKAVDREAFMGGGRGVCKGD